MDITQFNKIVLQNVIKKSDFPHYLSGARGLRATLVASFTYRLEFRRKDGSASRERMRYKPNTFWLNPDTGDNDQMSPETSFRATCTTKNSRWCITKQIQKLLQHTLFQY